MDINKSIQENLRLKKFFENKNEKYASIINMISNLNYELIILNKTKENIDKKYTSSYSDGFYIEGQKKGNKLFQVINDGKGFFNNDYLIGNINGLDENGKQLNSEKRFNKILEQVQKKVGGVVFGANFKKPANKIIEIDGNYPITSRYQIEEKSGKSTVAKNTFNLGYTDTVYIKNASNLAKDIGKNGIHIVGAVADCAAISARNEENDTISLTHAGWQGIAHGVLETLVKKYEVDGDLKNVIFHLSPMAGINYEWDIKRFNKDNTKLIKYLEKKLDKLYLDYYYKCTEQGNESMIINCKEKLQHKINKIKSRIVLLSLYNKITQYKIDPIKEKIIIPYENYPNKGHFYLDRLVKTILTKLGVPQENIHFTKDNNGNIVETTDFNNSWPSYRIHSLAKNGTISAEDTKKAKNGIVYDSRIIVVNGIKIKN